MALLKSWRCSAAAVAAAALVTSLGCSSSPDASLAIDGGSSSIDGGCAAVIGGKCHDGAVPADDGGLCRPADVSGWQPPAYHSASGAYQGKCSDGDIRAFYDACLGPNATTAACAPFDTHPRPACAACIVSLDADAKYGPVVLRKGVVTLNVAGCIELVDPAGLACAKSVQASASCEVAACAANCPVSDQASFDAFDACARDADADGCAAFAKGAECAANEDGGRALCSRSMSFDAAYFDIVPLFCGVHAPSPPPSPPAPDAGVIGDASGGG